MALFGAILYALVGLYSLLVIVRIIVEMVEAFSKQFDPPHWFITVSYTHLTLPTIYSV